MKKIILIFLAALLPLQSFAVTRLYDRSTGDIIDADKDDAEWDNTNNAINTHTADTSAHDATGGVVGVSKVQTLTNKTLTSPTITTAPVISGTVSVQNGSVWIWYSDTSSTGKVKINGSTGAAILGLTHEGQMTNCGVTVSGSTITIAGYEGTALSATNPCVVAIRSSTVGNIDLAYFTSNISTTFGATSDTDGNLFGITDANWSSTMPMFLGVVNGNTTPYFVMSRLPYVQTGSAATALCQEGDTDCDAQIDMLAMTTGLTLANEVNKPVTQVGWFDATYATTGGAWTFAITGKNGFNTNYEGVLFSMVTGQNGAASGSFLNSTGSNVPTWATPGNISYNYSVSKNGEIHIIFDTSNAGNCTVGGGAGGDVVSLYLPFAIGSLGTNSASYNPYGTIVANATRYIALWMGAGASSAVQLYGFNDSSAITNINENLFANASDDIIIEKIFSAF